MEGAMMRPAALLMCMSTPLRWRRMCGSTDSPLHRGVVGHIQFKDVYWQRLLFRKRTDFGGVLGIAPSGVTHRRENGVPFPSQGIGEQSAEAGAGAGDENHLLGIHNHSSLCRYRELGLMPEAKRLGTRMAIVRSTSGKRKPTCNPDMRGTQIRLPDLPLGAPTHGDVAVSGSTL